jgi:hypothetical protein
LQILFFLLAAACCGKPSDLRPNLTVNVVGEGDIGKRLPIWINIMARLKSVPIPTPATRYVQRY